MEHEMETKPLELQFRCHQGEPRGTSNGKLTKNRCYLGLYRDLCGVGEWQEELRSVQGLGVSVRG